MPNLLAKGAQRKQPIACPRPVAEMRYESLLMPTPKSLSNWPKPVPNPVMQKLHNIERSRMEYNAAIFFFVDQFWRHYESVVAKTSYLGVLTYQGIVWIVQSWLRA